MGFIDYVAEYFRGPAGADGAAGPEGPAGPGQIHEGTVGTFFETASETVEAGDYTVSIVLPEGAYLVSAWADATGGGENPSYTLPAGTTISVTQTDNRHYTMTLTLAVDVVAHVGDPDIVVNSRVLYYLPA